MLLALARTQKVDLAKISVLALAEQYLLFIAEARKLRLELAADYLVMAAWLAFLKSQACCCRARPSPRTSRRGDELAARLAFRLKRLEAMRNAAAQLMTRKRLGRDIFARGMPEGVRTIRVRQYTGVIYDLLKAYAEQRRRTTKRVHVVPRRTVWSIKEARQRLEALIGEWTGEWVQLDEVLRAVPGHARDRAHGGGELVRGDAGDGARGPGRDLAGGAVRAHLCAQARGRGGVAALSVEVSGRSESLQKKKGTEMVPPKLNVVPQRAEPEDSPRGCRQGRAHVRCERGAGARGLARAAAQRRPAAVGRPPRPAAHPRGAAVRRLRAAGRAATCARTWGPRTTSPRCSRS